MQSASRSAKRSLAQVETNTRQSASRKKVRQNRLLDSDSEAEQKQDSGFTGSDVSRTGELKLSLDARGRSPENLIPQNGKCQESAKAMKKKTAQHDIATVLRESSRAFRGDDPEKAAEKREVRGKYRRLINTVEDTRVDVLTNAKPEPLGNTLTQMDSLYNKVDAPPEAALDSQLLLTVADITVLHTQRLATGTVSNSYGIFNVEDFAKRVEAAIDPTNVRNDIDFGNPEWHQMPPRHESGEEDLAQGIASQSMTEDELKGHILDFDMLGALAERCMNRVPAIDLMLGNLNVQKKKATRAQKTKFSNGPVVTAREVDAKDVTANAMTETSDNVKSVGKTLREVCAKQPQRRIPLQHLVTNPRSFSETAENLFYLSFLVKDGKAFLWTDASNETWVYCDPLPEGRRDDQYHVEQLVCDLDYHAWKDRINRYRIQKSLIPSRVVQASA